MDDDSTLPDATPDRDYDTMSELPAGMAPADRPKVPSTMPPPGSCDCHVHMLGGEADFRLSERRAEDPARDRGFEGWLDLFRTHLDTLGIGRGVIVQSILYGSDNEITVEAVRRLGSEFRGIGLVADDAGDDAIERLAGRRMKGVRLNFVDKGTMSWEGAKRIAPKLAARNMHIQMLLRCEDHLGEIEADIRALPVPLVIDHIGLPDPDRGMQAPGFRTLLGLVEDGAVYVKLSGLYRVTDAPWEAADPFVAALVEANPDRCLWGSDWPHLLLGDAQMPDAGQLLDTFFRVVTRSEHRQKILVETPEALYGF